MSALPEEEHWPSKGMVLLNCFGVPQALQHPSNPAEMVAKKQLSMCKSI